MLTTQTDSIIMPSKVHSYVLFHQLTFPSSYQNDHSRIKIFVSTKPHHEHAQNNNIPCLTGSNHVVKCRSAPVLSVLTLHHSALDTIHEALAVSGGTFFDTQYSGFLFMVDSV